jgi:ribA/ribD-fused uncharacterized protein
MSKWIKNWFSNMLEMDTPLVYKGIEYKTVENFYQAMKTTYHSERKKIASMNPYDAKKYAKTMGKRLNWTKEFKLLAMEYGLKHKFKKGTTWHDKLMSTEDSEIIEWNNWGDIFWGIDVRTNKGENHLGKLLMKIRKGYNDAKRS